jgi:hypothetical protein
MYINFRYIVSYVEVPTRFNPAILEPVSRTVGQFPSSASPLQIFDALDKFVATFFPFAQKKHRIFARGGASVARSARYFS